MQENVKVYLESRAAQGDEVAAFILSTDKTPSSYEITKELQHATEYLVGAIHINGKKWCETVDAEMKRAINKINYVILKLQQ